MADTSIADVNEQMRKRIAQQLMFNSPGLAGSDTPQYPDLPNDALSQGAGQYSTPFADPNYFPSNSGVSNPAYDAITQAIGPQVSQPPMPQGFGPPSLPTTDPLRFSDA